jgi:hypothetical protein
LLSKSAFIFTFVRTLKILIVRLGLPALFLVIAFKNDTLPRLVLKLISIIFAISYVTLVAVFIKDTFTHIEHVDFYQLFDNLNFPFAHILSIITITISLDSAYLKKELKSAIIISIVTLNLVLLYYIQNKNTNLNDVNRKIIALLNDENMKKNNLYVVSETYDRTKNPYFQNPYMSLKNPILPWYVRNFKIVYANTLTPENDKTDSLYNKISRNNINILNDKDSLSHYNIGTVIYQ